MFLDHIQRRATVGRTPLNEWSVRRRDLYLTTHNTHNTNIHALGGFRTHDLSRRAAVDLRLTPRGHWDRLCMIRTRSLSSDLWLADHPGAEEYRQVWDHQHQRHDADSQPSDGLHELLRQPNPLRVPVGSLPQSIPQSGQMWPHGTARTWGHAVPKSINYHHPSPSKRQVRRWQEHDANPHQDHRHQRL